MTRRVGDDARPDGARPDPRTGDRPLRNGIRRGRSASRATDRSVPAEAVSRAPVLRFVALLSAVSGERRLIDDGGKEASIASSNKEEEMPNPGQPLIRRGDQGTAVFRAQRALRRTPDLSVDLDGDFGPDTEAAVKRFQEGAGLDVDGIVGDDTWAALPNGGPMPLLKAGSKGDVVRDLQEVLISGSEDGDWPSPGEADGDFGAETKASVEGFQEWGAGRCRRHRRRQDVGGASARGEQHSGNRCRTRLGRRLKRPARGRPRAGPSGQCPSAARRRTLTEARLISTGRFSARRGCARPRRRIPGRRSRCRPRGRNRLRQHARGGA